MQSVRGFVYPLSASSMESGSQFASIGELDQLRAFARGADLEVVQLRPGRMTGSLAHLDLGSSSLHLNRLALPARGRGALSAERWTFVVFPENVQGIFNGVPLSADILLAYPPGAEFQGTISSGFHDWIFTVEWDELSQTYTALFGKELQLRRHEFQPLRPNPGATQRLRLLADRALARAGQVSHQRKMMQMRLPLHHQVLELLATCVHSSCADVRPPRAAGVSRWAIVRRAEDFMREYADQPISLATLCVRTQTSERSLRRAFQDVIGVSPMTYLTAIRLNRACAELESPSPDSGTVASVAMRWQFPHLGRFAGAYKRFFGELPSDTVLRRLHEGGSRRWGDS